MTQMETAKNVPSDTTFPSTNALRWIESVIPGMKTMEDVRHVTKEMN